MNWCVVIPTYNNDKTLEKVIHDVLKVTNHVIVVNDGSTDNTLTILRQFPLVTTINYAENKGKGYALRKGFEKALQEGFQFAITLDSDGQHSATDIQAFIDKSEEFPNALIIGTRTLPPDKLRRGSGFANKFSNFWFRFISGVSLPDTQSGFRLYPLELLQNIRFYTRKYEFELEVLIRAAWRDIQLISIPINVFYPAKEDRISHYRPFKDFIRISLLNTVLVFIALLYIKPFSFLKYMRKESLTEFLKRHVIHTQDSNTKITFSVMFGVFMGIIPIWGYQLITAIALAYLLRLNKFIVIIAANISIPPMIPIIVYLSYLTGNAVLGENTRLAVNSNFTFNFIKSNLLQYIIGSFIFALMLSILIGLIVFVCLKLGRRNLIKSK
jgi:glycosyltransferase involved in cell wall biosynthesis